MRFAIGNLNVDRDLLPAIGRLKLTPGSTCNGFVKLLRLSLDIQAFNILLPKIWRLQEVDELCHFSNGFGC